MPTQPVKMSSRFLRITVKVGAPFLVFCGILVVCVEVKNLFQAHASNNWPTAEGIIRESSMEKVFEGTRFSLEPRIQYEYKIGDRLLIGSRIHYGHMVPQNATKRKLVVEKIIKKYPKNKRVKVYYMPEDPKICVLEPGITIFAWVMPIIGIGVIVLGSIAIKHSYRSSSSKEKIPGEP